MIVAEVDVVETRFPFVTENPVLSPVSNVTVNVPPAATVFGPVMVAFVGVHDPETVIVA